MTSRNPHLLRELVVIAALLLSWSAGEGVAEAQSAGPTSAPVFSLRLDDVTLTELEGALPTYEPAETRPDEKSVKLAQSGRFLLAVGVPVLFGGTLVASTSYSVCEYNDSNRKPWGWALFGAGAAVSISGIATLVAASKEARRAARTRKSRIALGLTAGFASIAGLFAGSVGVGGNATCNS